MSILLEAQLGALRDIDYGIILTQRLHRPWLLMLQRVQGSGAKLDCVVGIMKAYSSCVAKAPSLRNSSAMRRLLSGKPGQNTEPLHSDLAG